MSMPAKRPRLTFDVSEELDKAVETAAAERQQTLREFGIQALHEFLNPGLRFYSHRQNEAQLSLARFLDQAQEEIAMSGVTLRLVQHEAVRATLLRKVVQQQMPMRFVLIDPELDESDATYQFLQHRYGNLYGREGWKRELEATYAVLRELHEASRDVRTSVRVMGVGRFSTVGLTMLDPFSPHAKMRLALYLEVNPGEPHPFLEVHTESEAGRKAGYTLLRHFDRQTDGSRLILG